MELVPLDPIGAEVRGIEAKRAISDAEFVALDAALLEYGVLVLREQFLGLDDQVALGRRFGPIEGHEFTEGSPHPDVIPISNVGRDGRILPAEHAGMRSIGINEVWHTDSSFRDTPATVSIFAAQRVPEVGGDTFYASLKLGWQELSEKEQQALLGLRAIHDYNRAYDKVGGLPLAGVELPGVPHPVVRRHPDTRKPGLYVSGHAYSIEGMDEAEGRALLQKLVAWCTREGRVYRHRWQVGDLVLWDNRCMLHRAQGFDETHARVMYHVRVSGDEKVEAA